MLKICRPLFLLFLGLLASPLAQTAPLPMAFNHRPPYHYALDAPNAPRGGVAYMLLRVLDEADLEVEFVQMPGHRIMAETKKNLPLCSFSWFKTPERSQFAKFTLPLWQDAAFELVTLRHNEDQFRSYDRLEDLLQSTTWTLGSKAPTSYGPYIDSLLQSPDNLMRIEMIPTTQVRIIQALDRGRFDAVILSPDEADLLFQQAEVELSRYVSIGYSDIPEGGKRRIMCSRAVSDQTIEQLDRAIRTLAPNLNQ